MLKAEMPDDAPASPSGKGSSWWAAVLMDSPQSTAECGRDSGSKVTYFQLSSRSTEGFDRSPRRSDAADFDQQTQRTETHI